MTVVAANNDCEGGAPLEDGEATTLPVGTEIFQIDGQQMVLSQQSSAMRSSSSYRSLADGVRSCCAALDARGMLTLDRDYVARYLDRYEAPMVCQWPL